jgi:hypothetical protein
MEQARTMIGIAVTVAGCFLLLFARRIIEATTDRASSPLERRLTELGRGRGSVYFWAILLVIVGLYSIWLGAAK